MHGRIKTRSSDEQEKIKKHERDKKMVAYRDGMVKLTNLRTSGCFNEDALDLTCRLLLSNPDVLTVWNYRREILLAMRTQLNDDNFQEKLEKDLCVTEQCLRINSKSYGSWHHRIWILNNMPSPNWERELLLCKKYLEFDERNFHCWDYRRFLTHMANIPDESEYEFTLEKIKSNFSNYSAWHLRSKLLPRIFPDEENNLPISELKHKEELELVQNAAFTDPYDQSAWLYQRWLLGLTDPKIHFISIQALKDKIIAATSMNLSQGCFGKFGPCIKVEMDGKEINGQWQSSSGKLYSAVWILNLENMLEEGSFTLHLELNGNILDTVRLNALSQYQKEPSFISTYSSSLKEALAEELSSCNQLLDLEPDSKWTILTSLQLMQSIDPVYYEKEITNELKKLINIDPLRQGYYEDLSSKFSIECAIRHYFVATKKAYVVNNQTQIPKPKFVIHNKNLTHLYGMQYLLLVEDVDLSCNSITSEALSCLHCLLNCRRLTLDNNRIKTLKFLPILSKLTFLSLCNNNLEESAVNCLCAFTNLKEIHL